MTDVQWWCSGVMLERNFGVKASDGHDWPWWPGPLRPIVTPANSSPQTSQAVVDPEQSSGTLFDRMC